MIEVSGLVKYYGDRKVLHGLDFSVGVGRVCGFLGPNGSGKSTTMDILAGLLGPSDGQVKICGFDVVSQTKDVKALVGYLPDNPPLHKEMRVRDFVEYVAKLRDIPSSQRASAIERVLADCDITDVADRVVGNLSKGYRQRVALSAALVHQPKVLILDEPTEGLDPNQIVHIRNLIRKLAQDRTVILSSHILSEVQATCVDVIVINQGRIAAKTSISDEAARKPDYIFSFSNKMGEAVNWFKGKEFVKSAAAYQEQPHSILVSFAPEFWKESGLDALARINTQLVGQGFGVVGIQEHKTGLESLYFDVIKTTGGSTAAVAN